MLFSSLLRFLGKYLKRGKKVQMPLCTELPFLLPRRRDSQGTERAQHRCEVVGLALRPTLTRGIPSRCSDLTLCPENLN